MPVELVLVYAGLTRFRKISQWLLLVWRVDSPLSPAFKGSGRKKKGKGAACTAAKGTVVFIDILGGRGKNLWNRELGKEKKQSGQRPGQERAAGQAPGVVICSKLLHHPNTRECLLPERPR